MTGSRIPTSGQPLPSWSSDSDRAAWASTPSRSSEPATSPWMRPSASCQTLTAALERQPSTGKAIRRTGPRLRAHVRPAPVRSPPAKSCAAPRSNGPRGAIVNEATVGVYRRARPVGATDRRGAARTSDRRARPVGATHRRPAPRTSDGATTPTIARMTIYLDHAATTPLRPEALEAMLPVLTDGFGNPSSPHAVGRRARGALDEAREHAGPPPQRPAARDRLHERRHGGHQPGVQGGGLGGQGHGQPHRDQCR